LFCRWRTVAQVAADKTFCGYLAKDKAIDPAPSARQTINLIDPAKRQSS
jgi:hypothetical protein